MACRLSWIEMRSGRRGLRLARRVVRKQSNQCIEQMRLVERLGEIGAEQAIVVAGFTTSQRAEQHQGQRGMTLVDRPRQRDAVHLRHGRRGGE